MSELQVLGQAANPNTGESLGGAPGICCPVGPQVVPPQGNPLENLFLELDFPQSVEPGLGEVIPTAQIGVGALQLLQAGPRMTKNCSSG